MHVTSIARIWSNTDNLKVGQLSKFQKPSSTHLRKLQEWLRDPKGGNTFLRNAEAYTWAQADQKEFLTFQIPRLDQDVFTRWLTRLPVTAYHRIWGEKHNHSRRIVDEETGLTEYQEGPIDRIAKAVLTILASTLPMVAILGLYFQKDLLLRIYTAIGITAAFATVLAVFTQARRIEIFAATAALAAVEVVFIGSDQKR